MSPSPPPTAFPPAAALAASLALASLPTTAGGDTVSLLPAADTSIFEGSPEGAYNFGADRDGPAGTTGPMNGTVRSRALFRFDLGAAVPAGATITGGRFGLSVERVPTGAPSAVFQLRRMLVPWIEGVGFNPENPGGDPALPGEVTWELRAHPGTPWGAPGGSEGVDFVATVSAAATVTTGATYSWELNAAGVADLQAWLDTPGSNFGWVLLAADEAVAKSARRFYFKETLNDHPLRQGPPPSLEVDYTPAAAPDAPEVTGFGFDGENLSLTFLAQAGVNYEIQVNDGLAAADWATVQSFAPSAAGPISATVPNGANERRFVRILALAP